MEEITKNTKVVDGSTPITVAWTVFARKLESWVRIQLKAWMSVYAFILFVLACV
jgi:hypothetical protein